MKIHIVTENNELAEFLLYFLNNGNECDVVAAFAEIKQRNAEDLLVVLDPARIPAEPLADRYIILDFDLSMLQVDIRNPQKHKVPAVLQIDKQQLVVKICDGFEVPNTQCSIAFDQLVFSFDEAATAIRTAELYSNTLEGKFYELAIQINDVWNYVQLSREIVDELAFYYGRQLDFYGSYLTFIEERYEYYLMFAERATVCRWLRRIIDNISFLDCRQLVYKLVDAGDCAESRTCVDYATDYEDIEKYYQQSMPFYVSYHNNVVNIVPNVTSKFYQYLFQEEENRFASCVVHTHPFAAVHCKFWVEDVLKDVWYYMINFALVEGECKEIRSAIAGFRLSYFWEDFYEEYFVRQISSAAKLDIWINEKRMPALLPKEHWLKHFSGLNVNRNTQRALYSLRCQTFLIPEEPFERLFPERCIDLEQDFGRQPFSGKNLYYGLFAVTYYDTLHCTANEWKTRQIRCTTVAYALDILRSDGVDASAIFTTKGRILFPGKLDARIDPGTELVIDMDDGEDVCNYMVV